jgi:hypothetical protein
LILAGVHTEVLVTCPHCRNSKTFNNPKGFEQGLWSRKTGQPMGVPITSVFERLSSVKNAYWILLYAAKKLFL